ncbi:hypothetical protein D3C80_1781060 [compost metagenome]
METEKAVSFQNIYITRCIERPVDPVNDVDAGTRTELHPVIAAVKCNGRVKVGKCSACGKHRSAACC